MKTLGVRAHSKDLELTANTTTPREYLTVMYDLMAPSAVLYVTSGFLTIVRDSQVVS